MGNTVIQVVYSTNKMYRFSFNGKEKDNETYGEGNAYDFGARIQDPRLGKWLSLDPLQAKYPGLSPYNFTANNPIIFKDFDGKDFIYTVSGRGTDNKGNEIVTVSIQSTIHLYGKDAAKFDGKQYTKSSNDVKMSVYENGVRKELNVIVKVELNFVFHENLEAAQSAMKPGDNALRVDASLNGCQMTSFGGGPEGNDPVKNGVGGNADPNVKFGNVRKVTNINTIVHESLHLVGLGDRYKDIDKSDPNSVPIDDKGFEGTAMATNVGIGGKGLNLHNVNFYDLAKAVLSRSNVKTQSPESKTVKGSSGVNEGAIAETKSGSKIQDSRIPVN